MCELRDSFLNVCISINLDGVGMRQSIPLCEVWLHVGVCVYVGKCNIDDARSIPITVVLFLSAFSSVVSKTVL